MKSFYIFYFYLLNRVDAQKRSRVERSHGYKRIFTENFKRIPVNTAPLWPIIYHKFFMAKINIKNNSNQSLNLTNLEK